MLDFLLFKYVFIIIFFVFISTTVMSLYTNYTLYSIADLFKVLNFTANKTIINTENTCSVLFFRSNGTHAHCWTLNAPPS